MDSRLIVALDLPDSRKVLEIASNIAPEIFAVKVQWITVMDKGVSFISELSRFTRVLCDFKVADIPYTNSNITIKAREAGAWGIISHAFLGLDSLAAVVHSAGDMKVFSVVAMSHPGYEDVMKGELNRLIKITKDANAYGVIAPGNDYNLLRSVRSMLPELKIAAPGVGAQGGSAGDAIENGADYVIVGRGIYGSNDPLSATRAVNQEIAEVLGKA